MALIKHNKKAIKKIALQVQSAYQMGGLADGIYLDFATDVAIIYANSIYNNKNKKTCIANYQK